MTTRISQGEHTAAPQPVVRRGDAFDLIAKVPDESVDLILTSPPYWGIRTYGMDHNEEVLAEWKAAGCEESRTPPYDWYRGAGGKLGLEPLPSWYVDHLVEFFGRARRTLRPGSSLWVNIGDTYFARWSSIRDEGRQGLTQSRSRRRTPSRGYLHDKQLLLVPSRFAVAMQDAGWILRNDLIWAKPNPLPATSKDRLRLSHEHWFHFVQRSSRGRPSYFYEVDAAEPGARDVVVCSPASASNGHSAGFPTGIIRPRIETSSPEGGLVLDPFCGTGTAVAEALRLGRRAIGFELSAEYARAARSSVKRVTAALDRNSPENGNG